MKIELNKTNYPDFLKNSSTDEGVLLNNPFESINDLRSIEDFNTIHREILVSALKKDLEIWNAPAMAFKATEKLLDNNCYAIMCGQQPGIFGGPLFTFYKIIGTIKLCDLFAKKFPKNSFVPIFWLEGDDHDYEEIAQIGYYNKNGKFEKSIIPDNQHKRLHVGDRFLTEKEFNIFLSEVKNNLIETEFTESLFTSLQNIYNESNLSDGFAKFIYHVLPDTDLIISSSRNPSLKRLAKKIIKEEIEHPENYFNILNASSLELVNQNLPTPLKISMIQTFITYENERKQLEYFDNNYRIKNTDKIFSKQELIELAENSTELFSPKVTLRPIMQDAIFPTALFLGGPTELAYLRQLREGYKLFNIKAPIIAPRPFAIILEPKQIKQLSQLGISIEDLFANNSNKIHELNKDELQTEFEEINDLVINGINVAMQNYQVTIGKIDKTLNFTAEATLTKIQKELSHLSGKVQSALNKRNADKIEKYNSLVEFLFPNKSPQERSINAIYFINKFGLEKFRKLLFNITLENSVLQILDF